ncbi:MAG: DUF3822 family protein [Flavobacteriia bacterium]|jgi:hypothetical protein
MQQKFCIFYFQNALTVLKNDLDAIPVTRQLVSKIPSALLEEAKETLKEITGASFLYAPEFKHVYFGEQNLLIPSGVFEKDLAQSYFERMFIELPEDKALSIASIPSFAVHSLEAHPNWAKSFTKETFNHQNSFSLFEFHLNLLADFKTKETTFLLTLFADTYFLGLVHDSKLLYAEALTYQNSDDILYTLLNVLQKNGLSMAKGTLWFGEISDNNIKENLQDSLTKIQDFAAFTYQELERTMYFK